MADSPDDERIWHQDWDADAGERTEHLAPSVSSEPNLTLRPRSLPARLAASGAVARSQAQTLSNLPATVLRTIAAAATAKPMLTIQSAPSPRQLARATRDPEPEDVVEPEEAEGEMDHPAPAPPASGSLLSSATGFVLRLLRRAPAPEAESEAPVTPKPAPLPTSLATVDTPPAGQAADVPKPPVEEAPAKTPVEAAAPEAEDRVPPAPEEPQAREPETARPEPPSLPLTLLTSAGSPAIAPLSRTSEPDEDPAVDALKSEGTFAGREESHDDQPESQPPVVAEDVPGAFARGSDEPETVVASTGAPANEVPAGVTETPAPESAGEVETAPVQPLLARSQGLPEVTDEPTEETTQEPATTALPAETDRGGLFMRLRRLVGAPPPAASPQEAPTITPITRSATPTVADPAPEAGAAPLATETPPGEHPDTEPDVPAAELRAGASPMPDEVPAAEAEVARPEETFALSRFAVLRAQASRPEEPELDKDSAAEALEASAAFESESLALVETPNFGEIGESPSFSPVLNREVVHRPAMPASTEASASPAPESKSLPLQAPARVMRAEIPERGSSASPADAPLMRSFASTQQPVVSVQRAVLRPSAVEGTRAPAAEAPAPAEAPGLPGLVVRAARPAQEASRPLENSPADFFDERGRGSAEGAATFDAFASSPAAPVAREMTPLVYRQPRPSVSSDSSASIPSLAAGLGGYERTAFGGTDEGGVTDAGGIFRTLRAPAAVIERQRGEEIASTAQAGDDGATPAATPVQAPAAGGPAAAAPVAAEAADHSKAPNLVLDKLAREVYERLRRRLMVERERAGVGHAFN